MTTANFFPGSDAIPLINSNIEMLVELQSCVQSLNDRQYADAPSETDAAIGGHVRHVLEFYQALISHMTVEAANATLCYDERARSASLESRRALALETFLSVIRQIKNLPLNDVEISLKIVISANPNASMIQVRTSLFRELVYLLDHMIHHMALVRLIAEKHGVVLSEQFGLAQSTRLFSASDLR